MKNIFFGFILLTLLAACKDENQTAPANHGVHLAYMDTTVSPSQDFYRFVNGSWMDSVNIPADRGRWGSFDELRIKTSENTLDVLQTAMQQKGYDGTSDKGKAAIFYSVAMDTMGLDKIGLEPVQPFLNAIDAISSFNDINVYLSENYRVNGLPYFSLFVRSGFDVSDTNSLFLNPGALGLPERDYYVNNDSATLEIQQKYKSLLSKVFERLDIEGVPGTVAESVFQLEKAMAENQLTKVERRNTNLLNNPMAVAEVDKIMPFLDISAFLDNQGIESVDTIIVTQPEYISGLNQIIKATSIATHKAYLAWTVLHAYGNYLDTETEDLMFSFYGKVLEGTDAKKPRWERVLNTANNAIGEAIGQLYVDQYFPPAAKDEALRLVDNVKQAFVQRIRNLDWMTEETKEKALEKLSTFTVKIGYPDEWKDYTDLSLDPIEEGGSFASNMQQVMLWNWKDDVSKIGKAVDKSE